jgi:hypothetical protein
MRLSAVTSSPNTISIGGSGCGLSFPHHADVKLAAGDELLDDRVGLDAIVDERHPLLQRVVVAHDRRLRDADRRVFVQRLDDQREAEVAGTLRGGAARADHEVRDADSLVREHLLGQRLVARRASAPSDDAPVYGRPSISSTAATE